MPDPGRPGDAQSAPEGPPLAARRSGSDRVAWIDLAKAGAIILVVVFHVAGAAAAFLLPNAQDFWMTGWKALSDFLVPVRMPLFFLMSGLLAGAAVNRPWRKLFRSRYANLLWPYLIWSVSFSFVYGFAVAPPAVVHCNTSQPHQRCIRRGRLLVSSDPRRFIHRRPSLQEVRAGLGVCRFRHLDNSPAEPTVARRGPSHRTRHQSRQVGHLRYMVPARLLRQTICEQNRRSPSLTAAAARRRLLCRHGVVLLCRRQPRLTVDHRTECERSAHRRAARGAGVQELTLGSRRKPHRPKNSPDLPPSPLDRVFGRCVEPRPRRFTAAPSGLPRREFLFCTCAHSCARLGQHADLRRRDEGSPPGGFHTRIVGRWLSRVSSQRS
ncbi:acyltransferase [Mycetocola manganoxydans]|uniref:Acyltransferase n=1 Tax=Mycetocola manganoxydans TaxID=699879 RepID=A0A3L7A1H7_9MICO|nr:acyltransferase [Mycetocola manganoxydans]